MILQIVNREFSICKVTEIPIEVLQQEYTFFSKTDCELSLICETKYIPEYALAIEHGWKCFRIEEDASFEKYGMIAFLANIIAAEKTSTLVVGTYDTDYLLIKNDKFAQVIQSLKEHGCTFVEEIM